MHYLTKMTHYVARNKDGSIHVTNAVGGMIGQHHVHTQEDFATWEPAGEIKELEGCKECDCGLKPGEHKNGL
jgi:hypothetical protein